MMQQSNERNKEAHQCREGPWLRYMYAPMHLSMRYAYRQWSLTFEPTQSSHHNLVLGVCERNVNVPTCALRLQSPDKQELAM